MSKNLVDARVAIEKLNIESPLVVEKCKLSLSTSIEAFQTILTIPFEKVLLCLEDSLVISLSLPVI